MHKKRSHSSKLAYCTYLELSKDKHQALIQKRMDIQNEIDKLKATKTNLGKNIEIKVD